MKFTFNNAWPVFKEVISEFVEVNVLKMRPLLLFKPCLLWHLCSLLFLTIVQFFFGAEAIEGELYPQLTELIGSQAATQVEQMIKMPQSLKEAHYQPPVV